MRRCSTSASLAILIEVALLALCASASAQENFAETRKKLQAANQRATALYQAKDYEAAAAAFSEVEKIAEASALPSFAKSEAIHKATYNRACSLSLAGMTEAAIDALGKAFAHGWVDLTHVANDTDLDRVRGEERFAKLVAARRLAVGDLPRAAKLNGEAARLYRAGRYTDAIDRAREALAIRERALGPDHPDVADSLGNLAAFLKVQGSYAEARPLFERALQIKEEALGPDHPGVAVGLNNLATLLHALGAYAEAGPLYERALRIQEQAFGPGHPDLAQGLGNLAALRQAQGAIADARLLYERAFQIREDVVRHNLGGASRSERLALAATMRLALNNWLLFSDLAKLPSYDAVVRFKGLVTRAGAAEQRRHRQASGREPTYEALVAVQRILTRLTNAVPGEPGKLSAWRTRYTATAARSQELQLKLARESTAYGEVLRRLDLGIADIAAQLQDGEVLVDCLQYAGHYAAWIVQPDGLVARITLGEAKDIEPAVESFRDAILTAERPGDRTLQETGRSLGALVWGKIEKALPASTHTVYLSPDAALGALPFTALPGKAPGTSLIDDYTFVYLAFAQDLVPWETPFPPGTGVLAMGGVEYESATTTRPATAGATSATRPGTSDATADLAMAAADTAAAMRFIPRPPLEIVRFQPLGQTRAEAQAVARRLSATRPEEPSLTLTGAYATEANLRRFAPGRRVVHLATHGFVRHDLLANASEVGARKLDLLRPGHERFLVHYDRMVLTGLAFAGANSNDGGGDDDGILTALGASYLDLDGVQLVTLSACDTARGDAAGGEGIIGLARGFQTAGAKNVVASLWPVSDQATRRLMKEFYTRAFTADGLRPAAASMRRAALALRAYETDAPNRNASMRAGKDIFVRTRPFAAPRYWAAFVVYGPCR